VQANKDVGSWEKGTVGASERMQKPLERTPHNRNFGALQN
jgi:hypothetical protein